VLKASGARSKREAVKRTLSSLHTVNLGGLELAIEAAKNFRKLRALRKASGASVRSV